MEPLAKAFFCGSTSSPRTEIVNDFKPTTVHPEPVEGLSGTFARGSMECLINPTKAFMFRKTLLIFLLIGMFIYIPKSYGQDSCSAPSCPSLSISGPDKISYWESKYYTLTSDSSRNIRWSVDNPGAYITGDNNGATLVVGSACNCNNGSITITAKDTETGCYDTFRVQAGTWVEVIHARPDAGWFWCNLPPSDIGSCSSVVIVGDRRYGSGWVSCCYCAWGEPYCSMADAQVAAWRAEGGVTDGCENNLPTCSDSRCLKKAGWLSLTIHDWKCPTSSQSCSTTCSLSITDFKTSAPSFDPYSETVCLSGLIDEATGKSVGWTIEIKDSTGLIVKQFSGGAAYVGASWNGRDDNGEIVPDGIYKVILTAKTGDGKCTAKKEIEVTVQSECRFTISTDPPEVWPKIPQGQRPTGYTEDWNKAKILVSLAKPAPLGGCNIDFTVEPVENTGGHDHSGGRPKGTVEPASVNIPSGTEGTVKAAVYTSNMVSGEEKIIAKMKDKDGNEKTIDETTITVKVPELGPLGTNQYWRLTGNSGITSTKKCKGEEIKHSDSHKATFSTAIRVAMMAKDYYDETGATLGINDMSLSLGGLFDICSDWKKPHGLHRVGKSVDIDGRAQNSNGAYVEVKKLKLGNIAENYEGTEVIEGTIHYEFP